ncbi:MAG TPA: ABC transporter ATP-binding protein [Acidimicrobiales bacterium]|jgi:iron complex transport system ATP-binding protein|nr:ABC transporter ATP-binding protein [Acidimicrobiales bacterium]
MTEKPTGGPSLAAEDVVVRYGPRTALGPVALEFEPSTTTAVVGPNGCGKSTLLRSLARLVTPSVGTVYLDGAAITNLPTRAVARSLAVLPQAPSTPDGVTVAELVEQGRYAHVGPLRMLRRRDYDAVERALEVTGVARFRHRTMDRLSGGERQRAWIAVTLAQEPQIMLLDEPTTFLDIRHQLEILELIRRLNHERGITIVVALHDVNHAARYADRLVALKGGAVVADGPPAALLTPQLIEAVFDVSATVLRDPRTGVPVCIPYLPAGRATSMPDDRPGAMA